MIHYCVTGLERSGTTWLSHVLNEDESITVEHEPRLIKVLDSRVQAMAANGILDAEHHVRARYAYWQRHSQNGTEMAEVSHYPRYFAATVREVHQIPVAAIVRDGRLVVRSIYNHRYYQRAELPRVKPEADLAPFAACCWYWNHGYEALRAQDIPTWRLEDLNASFDAFASLCLHLGADVSEDQWQRWAGKRVNDRPWATEPLDWTPEQNEAFVQHAGRMQAFHGYPLPGEVA